MKKTNVKSSAKIHVLAKSTCNLIVGKKCNNHPKWRDVYNRIKDKLSKAECLPTPKKFGRVRVAREHWVCNPRDFYIQLKKSFELAPNTTWDDVKDAIFNESYTLDDTLNHTNFVDCGTFQIEINLTKEIQNFEKDIAELGNQINALRYKANQLWFLLPTKEAKRSYSQKVRKSHKSLLKKLSKRLPNG